MHNFAQNQTESPLSWDIVENPIFSNNQPIRGYKALFRSDNQALLNVTKSSYTPTKNERFLEVVERMSTITGFPVKCHDRGGGPRI
jgi:hypothetical protein